MSTYDKYSSADPYLFGAFEGEFAPVQTEPEEETIPEGYIATRLPGVVTTPEVWDLIERHNNG